MDGCVNRRGRHRADPVNHRRGPDCAKPVPDYPPVHRFVGAAAVGALTVAGVLTVAAVLATQQAAEQARLRAALRAWRRDQQAARP